MWLNFACGDESSIKPPPGEALSRELQGFYDADGFYNMERASACPSTTSHQGHVQSESVGCVAKWPVESTHEAPCAPGKFRLKQSHRVCVKAGKLAGTSDGLDIEFGLCQRRRSGLANLDKNTMYVVH